MAIVTLSSKSQFVLPAKLRRRLDLGKGDKLIVEEKNGAIIIKPVVKLSKLIGVDKGNRGAMLDELKTMRNEWDDEIEDLLKGRKMKKTLTR